MTGHWNPPHRVQWLNRHTEAIPWLLIAWRREEPGHQQPWYWSHSSSILEGSSAHTKYMYVSQLTRMKGRGYPSDVNFVWSIHASSVIHFVLRWWCNHYCDVIISSKASQYTGVSIVCSTIFFRHRSKKTSKLRVTGPCERSVDSPHKGPVTRKMFPLDDVFMSIPALSDRLTTSMKSYFETCTADFVRCNPVFHAGCLVCVPGL